MIQITPQMRILVGVEAVDFRKGIDAPEGVGTAKYDATATSMVGLLKYGCGLPFHRIEVLQRAMRIPLPAATQWELVRDALPQLVPPWDEFLRQAAQGEVVYNDDTTMKVLALTAEQRRAAAADEETDARTGVFTSGIVATRDGHRIALFFTGRQHAGENLADVLAQRAADLAPPIQMCDALPTNTAGDFDTLRRGRLQQRSSRAVKRRNTSAKNAGRRSRQRWKKASGLASIRGSSGSRRSSESASAWLKAVGGPQHHRKSRQRCKSKRPLPAPQGEGRRPLPRPFRP